MTYKKDPIVDAIYRAKMMEKYGADPGSNWDEVNPLTSIGLFLVGIWFIWSVLSS
tara:strand:- start:603 stop:767 length:165 start_codon:yes stop_codon:yes gene_type:complete